MKSRGIHGLAATFLILAVASVSFGQRDRVVRDDDGFSFKIPDGFTSAKTTDGYGLNESTGNLTVLVVKHAYADAAEFAEKVDLDTYGLVLEGEPTQVNTTDYSFRASGLNEKGTISVEAFAMFSPNGGGLVILAIATEAYSKSAYPRAKQVFDSVRFFKREVSAIETKATNLLRGKTLYKRVYRSGYSEEVVINLCRDGSYSRRSSANSSGATLADNSRGNWSIVKAGEDVFLVLQAVEGKSQEIELEEDTSSLKLKLNGVTYFVRENNC